MSENRAGTFRRLLMLSCFAVALSVSVGSIGGVADAAASSSGVDKTPPFVATLQPQLEAEMKQLHVPGAIFSVNLPGQGDWTTALGVSDLATGAPMNVRSAMRIGSITKTFTATIVLRLVEEGRLQLDDPIGKYRSDVPDGANITIRELLNMTSGLFDYTEDSGFVQAVAANPQKLWTPQELLKVAFSHQPYFPPGQSWRYSSTNYIVLGLLIEQITGQPIARLFQREIFEPLGMSSTYLPAGTSGALPNPHPHGYEFPSATATTPLDVTDFNPSLAWAAGAAISTAHDLRIWASALATGRLLSPAVQQERLSWIDLGVKWVTTDLRYGLGVGDFGGVIGHDGSVPGFESFEGYVPQKGATVVVLTNLSAAPDGTPPADALEQIIQRQLFS
jgi:D-alanyl-D-alanine carboxypeptidase